MLWLLGLHIFGLLVWLATVLYLPILIATESKMREDFIDIPFGMGSLARLIFAYVASPAAIISIIAGTLVFVINDTLTFWLMVKLTIVTILVILHASLGLLITRLERQEMRYLAGFSWYFLIAIFCCVGSILFVVLAKPAAPGFVPWPI